MVSFDVESLFTNISLKGCIDLAVNYISERNPHFKGERKASNHILIWSLKL